MVHPVLHGAGYPPENGKMVAEYDTVQSVPVLRKILQGIFPWYCEIDPWDSCSMENSTFVPYDLSCRIFRTDDVLSQYRCIALFLGHREIYSVWCDHFCGIDVQRTAGGQ